LVQLTNRTLDTPDTPLLPPEHFSFSITLDNLYSRISVTFMQQ